MKLSVNLKSVIVRFLRSFSLLLIAIYRVHLSPFFTGQCRFEPSCSAYAHEAYARFGFLKATLLTFKRLGRCRPFGGSGYDPVPKKGQHE